jgi:hypothetical protein
MPERHSGSSHRASRQARPAAPDPEGELRILQRAQATLDRNAARSLELAESHARQYPRGVFLQEREILAIEALLKLSRKPAAYARADAFLAAHASSPHARRVRALLNRSGR